MKSMLLPAKASTGGAFFRNGINYFTVVLVLVCTACFLLNLTGCKVGDTDGNGNGDGGGGEYYVSPGGSDSDSGSRTSPWGTVQYALDQVQPGDILTIMPGTYEEALTLNRSGSEGKHIKIQGQSFSNTVLDGGNVARDLFFLDHAGYVEISNLTFARAPRAGLRLSYSNRVKVVNCVFANNGKWGIFTDFSDNTTIENIEVYGSQEEHGIYISNSSDYAEIRNNIVHHNRASGIQINADPSMGGDGISSGCIIENNLVYENGWDGGAAINLASVRDSQIRNNMVYYNYAGGIAGWDDGQGLNWGCKNLEIIHNTIYFRPLEGRWAISLKNGSTDATIRNNLLIGGAHGGFEFNTNSRVGIDIDYNIYYRYNSNYVVSGEDVGNYTLGHWKSAGFDLNSWTDLPQNLFVNMNSGDIHIKASASAVDRGSDQGLTYDFEGDPRPNGAGPDIGADERN